jgi:hypothetical protein
MMIMENKELRCRISLLVGDFREYTRKALAEFIVVDVPFLAKTPTFPGNTFTFFILRIP